jgi:transcriptional regulator GlxA family with amidase domain
METSPKRAVSIAETIDWQYPDGRITHAMYLIQTTDLSVTQIAYEVGFVEMRTFAREFRKRETMTPKEFKNSLHPD